MPFNRGLLQYSCLENPMEEGAWWAAVHGVATSRTWLNDFTFTFHFHALEEEMATQSRILAWRLPGTGEPGGLPSMGSHRVGHDWNDLAAAAGGTGDQIANICWIIEMQESSRKTSTSGLLTMLKPLTVWVTTHFGKLFKRYKYHTTWPASWEICMQVKKQ